MKIGKLNIDKDEVYKIIFESDTPMGKRFDVVLLWVILASVVVAALDSVPAVNLLYSGSFITFEWIFTILFSLEYVVRIWSSPRKTNYVFSFWGMIDLMSILPTYLSLFFFGFQYLIVVRILRLLRIFRVLKLVRYNAEALTLIMSIKRSLYKISIFMFVVLIVVIVLGTTMYVVEGGENGFSSIPQGIYWGIITITTVGYGDIVPTTVLGKFISSVTMLIGYAIIAVPTGIITVEMSRLNSTNKNKICKRCRTECADDDNYCSKCGNDLKIDDTI